MSWSGKFKNGESFNDLTDDELNRFESEIDESTVSENVVSQAPSPEMLRIQAREQYAQDVANQRAENIQEYKEAHPILSAILPRTAENAANDDRGFFGKSFDTAKDIFSVPGRGISRVVAGTEGLSEADREEYPKLALAHDIAKGIVESPVTIPMMAISGGTAPLIGKIASPAVRALTALATEPALNVGAGIIDRATEKNEAIRAFDSKAMAIDAALGAIPGGFAGAREWGRGAKDVLAKDILAGLEPELRQPLLTEALAEKMGNAPKGTISQSSISDAAEYALSTPEGQQEALKTIADRLVDVPGLLTRRKIASSVAEGAKQSSEAMQGLLRRLDDEYASAVQGAQSQQIPDAIDAFGEFKYKVKDVVGNDAFVASKDLRKYGVPVDAYVASALDQLQLEAPTKYTSRVELANEVANIKANLDALNLPQSNGSGIASPSMALDISARFKEAAKNAKDPDIKRLYNEAASSIQEHIISIAPSIAAKPTVMYQNMKTGDIVRESEIPSIAELANYRALPGRPYASAPEMVNPRGTIAYANKENLLAKGIAGSKYMGRAEMPSDNRLLLGAQFIESPRAVGLAAAKDFLDQPVVRHNVGALAEGLAPSVGTAGRQARSENDRRFLTDLLVSKVRNLTEREYRTYEQIIAKRPSERSTAEKQYLLGLSAR